MFCGKQEALKTFENVFEMCSLNEICPQRKSKALLLWAKCKFSFNFSLFLNLISFLSCIYLNSSLKATTCFQFIFHSFLLKLFFLRYSLDSVYSGVICKYLSLYLFARRYRFIQNISVCFAFFTFSQSASHSLVLS